MSEGQVGKKLVRSQKKMVLEEVAEAHADFRPARSTTSETISVDDD